MKCRPTAPSRPTCRKRHAAHGERSAQMPTVGVEFSRTKLGTLRASGPIPDDGDTLNLDLPAGASKVGDGDERAPGVVAVRELLLAELDEAVAVPRLLDEDRNRDEIRERAAGAPQGLVDQREHAMRLGLEVAGDVLAVAVHRRGLAGQPDDASALGDDSRRVRPALLLVGPFEILHHRDSFLRSPTSAMNGPRIIVAAGAASIGL